jgi:hypothetical protein
MVWHRRIQQAAIVLTVLLLLLTAAWVWWERSWLPPEAPLSPKEAFVHGSIGTEFVPLPVLEVLPDLAPDYFPPDDADGAGGWVDRYGFLRRRPAETDGLANAPAEVKGLPVGFSVSRFRPGTGDPSPVAFVGLACAGCHSARLPDRNHPDAKLVYGAGNPSLDLPAFFEGFRAALLKTKLKPGAAPRPNGDVDEDQKEFVVTMDAIEAARAKRELPRLSAVQRFFVSRWLSQTRALLLKNLRKYDPPGTPEDYAGTEFNPVGPGRTQPFRTLVNTVLDLPANRNHGFSKIPAVYQQDRRQWAQFDGSIADHHARSALAAMTAGGTVDSLASPVISHNIKAAADYTFSELVGPRYAEIFPAEPRAGDEVLAAGKAAYETHCGKCHGRPDPGGSGRWLMDPALDPLVGKVIPLKDAQGRLTPQATDPERVFFPFREGLDYTLFKYFDAAHPHKEHTGEYYPIKHPLAFARDEIRTTEGYVNGPIDSAFSRAPYLHNASVPTLRQLINLDPRPATFWRGRNDYDAKAVGVAAPARPDPAGRLYWFFDTRVRGNRNFGHDYPWPYGSKERDEKQLEALLEYLKTL